MTDDEIDVVREVDRVTGTVVYATRNRTTGKISYSLTLPPGFRGQVRDASFVYKGSGRQPTKQAPALTKSDRPGFAPYVSEGGPMLHAPAPEPARPRPAPESGEELLVRQAIAAEKQKLAAAVKPLRPEMRDLAARAEKERMEKDALEIHVLVRNLRVKPGLNDCGLCRGPVGEDLPVTLAFSSRAICEKCGEKYAKKNWNLLKEFDAKYPKWPFDCDSEAVLTELTRKLDCAVLRLDQRHP